MLYLVTYTLNPSRDATKVISTLQESPYWAHYMDDAWLISTRETIDQLYSRIIPSFIKTDRIIIVPITQYKGWLPQEAWDWIKEKQRAFD